MNSLLVYPDELASDGTAVLTGERARHLLHTHRLKAGLTVRGAVLDRGMGTVTITAVNTSEPSVAIEVSLTEPPWARVPLVLVVAFARPQTVKKVLHLAAVTGIEELHFVRAARIEKSYMTSQVLQPAALHAVLRKGIEQSGDSVLPHVTLHDRFKPFVEDYLSARCAEDLKDASLLLADPRASEGITECSKPMPRAVIALGPEAGWEQHEVEAFQEQGFFPPFTLAHASYELRMPQQNSVHKQSGCCRQCPVTSGSRRSDHLHHRDQG